jgi:membrane fusion protein (multidrug efflux system)
MVRNLAEDAPDDASTPAPPPDSPRPEADSPAANAPPGDAKRRWVLPAAVALLVLGLAGGIYGWWYARTYESTDDAYTQAHVVEVSAQVAGRVERVLVNDNDDVQPGQVLVEIDPRDYAADVRQAEANLKVAQAEADRANAVLARTQRAGTTGAVSAQDVDEALAAARKANAQVAQSEAGVATAQLRLSYTHIVAPFAGRVARKNIEPGAYVTPGQAMLSVVDPAVWVEANFKETQLKVMKAGDRVRIRVDAFPHLEWHGHIDSIQPGSGARFSVLPAENATGNFVKVVQRVPVKIVFDDYTPGRGAYLGVGLSVRPRVAVR